MSVVKFLDSISNQSCVDDRLLPTSWQMALWPDERSSSLQVANPSERCQTLDISCDGMVRFPSYRRVQWILNVFPDIPLGCLIE